MKWTEMSEADKRQHLAQKHGYVPEAMGGWDAWVLEGRGTVAELDSLHETDHGTYNGGGGPDKHHH